MMEPLHSDSNFRTRGKVISLTRGRPGGHRTDMESLVTLNIKSGETNHLVDLPIKTKSDFEVLPYQASLAGVEVSYSKEYDSWEEGINKKWELEVLSGLLQGNIYKFSAG
ncbi:MAG: hypothetical protein AABW79_04710 [Nanoarchaeota archaeon]